jgi:hypothetical protein
MIIVKMRYDDIRDLQIFNIGDAKLIQDMRTGIKQDMPIDQRTGCSAVILIKPVLHSDEASRPVIRRPRTEKQDFHMDYSGL